MTLNQKVANYKIVQLLKVYQLYFGCLVIYSSNLMVLTLFTNLKILCISLVVSKLRERYKVCEQIYFYFIIYWNDQN
jgi:hypothetical protein